MQQMIVQFGSVTDKAYANYMQIIHLSCICMQQSLLSTVVMRANTRQVKIAQQGQLR